MAGPQPLSGRPQTVVSDMGAWKVTLANVRLHGDRIRTFRALFFGTLAQGLPVYLPMYDWRRGPRVRSGLNAFPAPTPFADTTVFTDSTDFDGDAAGISLAAVAAARATQLLIATSGDPVPIAGEFIGLGDRAHMVTGVSTDTLPANQALLRVQPPLRAAGAIGDPVETMDPVCRMQLDPKGLETAVMLDLAIIGRVSLDFYEANWT